MDPNQFTPEMAQAVMHHFAPEVEKQAKLAAESAAKALATFIAARNSTPSFEKLISSFEAKAKDGTAEEWMRKVEDAFEISTGNNAETIPSATKIMVAGLKLRGKEFQWYNSRRNEFLAVCNHPETRAQGWDYFKASFLQEHALDQSAAEQKLLNDYQHDNEGLRTYYARFRLACQSLYGWDETEWPHFTTRHFMQTVAPGLQSFLEELHIIHPTLSFSELINKGIALEKARAQPNVRVRPMTTDASMAEIQEKMRNLTMAVGTLTSQIPDTPHQGNEGAPQRGHGQKYNRGDRRRSDHQNWRSNGASGNSRANEQGQNEQAGRNRDGRYDPQHSHPAHMLELVPNGSLRTPNRETSAQSSANTMTIPPPPPPRDRRQVLNSEPMDIDSGARHPFTTEATPDGAVPFRTAPPKNIRPTTNRTPEGAVPFRRPPPVAPSRLRPMPPHQGPPVDSRQARPLVPPRNARSFGNPEGIAQHVADTVFNTQVPLTVRDLSSMSPQIRTKLRDIVSPTSGDGQTYYGSPLPTMVSQEPQSSTYQAYIDDLAPQYLQNDDTWNEAGQTVPSQLAEVAEEDLYAKKTVAEHPAEAFSQATIPRSKPPPSALRTEAYINGYRCQVIVDTGCSTTTISENAARKCGMYSAIDSQATQHMTTHDIRDRLRPTRQTYRTASQCTDPSR